MARTTRSSMFLRETIVTAKQTRSRELTGGRPAGLTSMPKSDYEETKHPIHNNSV
jgi:hypothetical protein